MRLPRIPFPPVPKLRSLPWLGSALGLLLVIGLGITAFGLIADFLAERPVDLTQLSRDADARFRALATECRVPSENVQLRRIELRQSGEGRWFEYAYALTVPEHVSAEALLRVLEDHFYATGAIPTIDETREHTVFGVRLADFEVLRVDVRSPDSMHSRADDAFDHRPAERDLPLPTTKVEMHARSVLPIFEPQVSALPKPPKTKPRMAIIIDDGGYGGEWTDRILALGKPFTVAVLPYTPQGTSLAEEAIARGFEVILHMPMENDDPDMVHEGQLSVDMSVSDMRSRTVEALSQIPGAVGVNNHTGSRFTADSSAMERFFEAIDDLPLYFVDSRTAPDSRAYSLARAAGIPSAERDLFLDHDNEIDAIRRRFQQAIEIALEENSAIVICHFRPNTAAVLAEMLPVIEASGIELVYASELIE